MENVFRKDYRELSEDEKNLVNDIKNAAQDLYNLIDGDGAQLMEPGKARALAVAKTKLEESVMWAVKGITG